MMDRIVQEAERHMSLRPAFRRTDPGRTPPAFSDAAAEAAGRAAAELEAAALVAFTQSGFTARLISKHRPAVPLIAYTPTEGVFHQLAMYWGVTPRIAPVMEDLDRLIAWADHDLLDAGLVRPGDTLVFLAGAPVRQHGITNLMRLHRAGAPVA